MIVRVLKINNIRSYQDATIEFPAGSFLLSGDIGAGKTTVLMAIEFALFGLMRGSINGSDLLRHGTNDGSVSLTFELNDKIHTVFRRLKRTSTGISQDSGYLEINGVRENLVHTELKSRILELLGYPKTLISKSKGLIFRYTTYTPQEEVKKIMYESPELRLDTLRKVFGLDKYKTAKENTLLLIKEIKQKEAILSAKIDTEKDYSEEKVLLGKKLAELEEKKTLIQEKIILAEKDVNSLKVQMEDLVKEKEEYNKIKQKKELLKVKKEQLTNSLNSMKRRIEDYKVGEKPELTNAEGIRENLENAEKLMSDIEEKIGSARNKKSKILANIEMLSENNNIEHIQECPTCKQEVSNEHKEKIRLMTEKKVSEEERKKSLVEEYLKKAEEKNILIKKKIVDYRELQKKAIISEQQYKQYQEKLAWKQNSEAEYQRIKSEISEIEGEDISLILPKFDESLLKHLKEKYEEKQDSKNKLQMMLATCNNDLIHSNEKLEVILKQIEELKLVKEKIKNQRTKKVWLQEYFINAISSIEKNLMLSIYNQFNSSFQEWFETLISDETITARLDETFTPYIIQNGQNTSFENLSGGEKTSISLAYRLALNKVIIDFMNNINTKDLLILDEPTDGFSTTQLDKIRDVLEKIPAKQIIIVSHEPKLESFVEEIIRIHKTGHITNVA